MIGGPERDHVVDRAERKADDDRQDNADGERDPLEQARGEHEPEHDGADEERRDPTEERVIQRAPQVERERRAQWMDRPDEIARDVT